MQEIETQDMTLVRDREVIKSREGQQVGTTNLGYELNKLLFFILPCLKYINM